MNLLCEHEYISEGAYYGDNYWLEMLEYDFSEDVITVGTKTEEKKYDHEFLVPSDIPYGSEHTWRF